MNQGKRKVALLLADISGSTPLYEKLGNAAAFDLVGECLGRLQKVLVDNGGVFVSSKGDDVLGTFACAADALDTAREMLLQQAGSPLDVHIGIHYGDTINFRGDVYGDTVNTAARLSALAKSGEILASGRFVDQLSAGEKQWFHLLDSITLKGLSSSTRIYTLMQHGEAERTRLVTANLPPRPEARTLPPRMTVMLEYRGAEYTCTDREALMIGRADDCGLVIPRPWISRHHARIASRHGRMELEDQSVSGTYFVTQDGQEIFIHRDKVLLTGAGMISPAVRSDAAEAEVIRYTVSG